MSGPMNKSDQATVRQFAIMIGLLGLVALLLIATAMMVYKHEPKETNPNKPAQVAARIAPAGAVYAGDTGRAAMQAAAEAAAKASAGEVAYGGTTDGLDTLVKHAIDGYHGPDGNFMPPKGGNPALTDEQVTNAVHWIADQVK